MHLSPDNKCLLSQIPNSSDLPHFLCPFRFLPTQCLLIANLLYLSIKSGSLPLRVLGIVVSCPIKRLAFLHLDQSLWHMFNQDTDKQRIRSRKRAGRESACKRPQFLSNGGSVVKHRMDTRIGAFVNL